MHESLCLSKWIVINDEVTSYLTCISAKTQNVVGASPAGGHLGKWEGPRDAIARVCSICGSESCPTKGAIVFSVSKKSSMNFIVT